MMMVMVDDGYDDDDDDGSDERNGVDDDMGGKTNALVLPLRSFVRTQQPDAGGKGGMQG